MFAENVLSIGVHLYNCANKILQLQKLDILSPSQIEKSEKMLVKLYDKLDDIEKNYDGYKEV